ncbi:DedA family protein [Pseudooceanicola aestuarii]|uniref:DedA family protein n=1 Tax=Pseudooceanicola aestuarii TaxID=2697319 RepID=UPI0013D10AD1|nr:DedA family protein [Pseudooceanicola aestuarii]
MFDWIAGVISAMGYGGLALLMFLENVFPPIPSELIMPLAGFHAAEGRFAAVGVVLAGSAGSVAGVTLWYWAGRRYRADRLRDLAGRHGRWLSLTPAEVDRALDWFDRHGEAAVFLGRLVPALRTLISIPAGLGRMPLWRFLLWTTGGSLIWNALLTAAGHVLHANYDRVQAWLDPVSTAVVVGMIAIYLYRVATFGRRSGQQADRARRSTDRAPRQRRG